jgi:hypothetical protein
MAASLFIQRRKYAKAIVGCGVAACVTGVICGCRGKAAASWISLYVKQCGCLCIKCHLIDFIYRLLCKCCAYRERLLMRGRDGVLLRLLTHQREVPEENTIISDIARSKSCGK